MPWLAHTIIESHRGMTTSTARHDDYDGDDAALVHLEKSPSATRAAASPHSIGGIAIQLPGLRRRRVDISAGTPRFRTDASAL